MAKRRGIVTCVRCRNTRQHGGRGLCTSCFILTGPAPHGDGTRENYPRTVRPPEHTIDDYRFLSEQGLTHNEIATRLSLTPEYLRALMRKAEQVA